MLALAIDAVIFIALIKAFNGQEMYFGTVSLIALLAGLVHLILYAIALQMDLGLIGAIAALLAMVVLVFGVLTALWDVETKRAATICGLFVALRLVVDVVLWF